MILLKKELKQKLILYLYFIFPVEDTIIIYLNISKMSE